MTPECGEFKLLPVCSAPKAYFHGWSPLFFRAASETRGIGAWEVSVCIKDAGCFAMSLPAGFIEEQPALVAVKCLCCAIEKRRMHACLRVFCALALGCAAISVSAASATDKAQNEAALQARVKRLVGLSIVFPPGPTKGESVVPNTGGCIDYAGGLLQIDGKSVGDVGYAYFRCEERGVLVLEKIIPAPRGSHPTYEILDAVLLPEEDKRTEFFYPVNDDYFCENTEKGSKDTGVFVFGKMPKHPKFDVFSMYYPNHIYRAWRPNVKVGRFEEIPANLVRCGRNTPP